ncbi:protein of unknown function [Cupriavidus taiwanensis]|nr:protein of unknown function [Cupriavidus taiwanensis]
MQAGAVMTAMVYHAKGKLAKADEVDFTKRWSNAEGLNAAMTR